MNSATTYSKPNQAFLRQVQSMPALFSARTVELKPRIPVDAFTKNVEELYMTQHRSVVPEMLEKAGVTADQWRQTFEDLIALYDNYIRLISKTRKRRALIKKRRATRGEKIAEVANDHQEVWQELVEKQAATYEPLGIKVQLATQAVSYRTGSDLNMRVEPVGLQFHVSRSCVGNGNSTGVSSTSSRSLGSKSDTSTSGSSSTDTRYIYQYDVPSTIHEKLRLAQS